MNKYRSAPVVRTGASPDDPHEIVLFTRHRADDRSQSVPGQAALNSYPTKVRATMRAALIAVASAPPKRFAGGGYWEAMKGDMTGWFELRGHSPDVTPGPSPSGCGARRGDVQASSDPRSDLEAGAR